MPILLPSALHSRTTHSYTQSERMFKLQRPTIRPTKSKQQRVDFKFSNFQALQVPKGWDKLFVSLVCVETGKTMAKLGKAIVKNGCCQWTETLSESIYISRDDSSKGYQEYLVKLVVSTGLTRSSPLGEITIDMAHYTSSRVSPAFSQPLKKCSHGTILQVKIQCSAARSKIGDEEPKDSPRTMEKDLNVDHRDEDSRSYGSDHNSRNSSAGPPSEDSATTSRPMKLDSKEASSSVEGSIEREKLSRKNAFKSELYEYNSHERQVGSSSDDHGPLPDYLSVDHIVSPSNQSSSNSRLYLKENFQNKTNYLCSSKNLLEAAEDTIEELRAEAKMWERNARKLMIDLDISRKESSDLSKKQAELVMELSAENAENDGLKKEVDKLKAELQKLTMNQIAREDSFIQSESLVQIQKVLENEIKYQQDLNDNLAQQLKRSQESNIELLSVLSELEENIEEQKIEIEKLQGDIQLLEEALRDKTNELENERKSNRRILLDVEKDHKHEISVKEEEIASLEATVSGYVKGEHLEVLDEENENNVDLLKEIESLREKVQELERDCIELTDENLELLFKLKDSNKTDIRKCASFDSMSSEHPNVCPSDASEVSDPNFHISHLEEELKKKVGEEEQKTGSESSEHCYTEISKQLDTAFDLLMKPWYDLSSDQNGTRDGFLDGLVTGNKRNSARSTMSAEYILSFLRELNKQMELRMTECGKMIGNHEIEIQERNDVIADAKRKMEESILQVQELEKSMAKSEENYANLMKELDQKRSEINLIEANLLSKEQENNFLLHRQRELEAEVSELQLEKSHLEQNIELALRERNISTECVENLQNVLTVLRNTVSSHVSANADLEKSLEMLEREKGELENTMLGFQEENTQLHECVSGLETQVKQLKDEKEFSLRETDNLKSVAMNLQKLKTEMDIQILDLEQKVEDMQKRWLGAQEECEYLKGENKTLQASAASSVQDCMKLQDSNSELERVNRELQESCSALVSQLCESKKSLSDCSRKAELLEDRLTSVLDDFSVRENSLRSELDALVKQNISQKEKLALEESLHQVFMEKTIEFESLQKEVEHLTSQLSDACKERDRISFEASIEVSRLLAEKTELQASLQGVQSELADCKLDKALQESELKVQDLADECESLQKEVEHLTRQLSDARKERDRISFEASDDVSRLPAEKAELQASLQGVRLEAELADSKLQNTLQESELKVQDLANELVASKQSHERLMAEHERILKLLAGYKRSEEKLKTELNDLELKHTISDYERQQLTKEMGILKVQLHSLSVLQDEISVLRRDLNGCRLDKGKLEHALETISGDYEELKAEKISFSEKLSSFQNAMSEFEQCKRNKLALEEKLLQMEKELTTKDILEVQNADLDNELTEIKRANTQFQQKMYRLEEEKDEYLKKAQALEEDLKLMVKRNDIIHKEGMHNSSFDDESPVAVSVDHVTKRRLFENEVSERLDANNNNRVRHESPTSSSQKKSTVDGGSVPKERYERTKSSLETELRDLRERYLEMSLKYAEVESEREDLVMKLKANRSGKRWFG